MRYAPLILFIVCEAALLALAGCCSPASTRSAVVTVNGGTNTITVSNQVDGGGTFTPTLKPSLGN